MKGSQVVSKRVLWVGLINILSVSMFAIDYAGPSVKTFPYLELVAALMLFGYFRQLHKDSPAFLYTSFYQVYSLIGVAVSLLFIGLGTPMLEIAQEGSANGGIWITLIFSTLGLEFGRVGFNGLHLESALKTRQFNRDALRTVAYIASAFVLAVGVFILLTYGSPIFLGITRVSFWNGLVSETLVLYPSLLGQTFFLGAFFYLDRRQRKAKDHIAFSIVILYVLATIFIAGEKFSTFIFYMTVWLALCAGLYGRLKIDGVAILVAGLTVVIIFAMLALSYSISDKGVVFILYRVAMQGQLLWSVLSEQFQVVMYGVDGACFFGCDLHETGVDFISAKYLPPGIWDSYVETGSGLTGFMPALPILVIGLPLTLIVHLFISLALGGLQRVLVVKIKCRDLVMSLLLFKIYFGLLVFWYASKISVLPGVFVTVIMLVMWLAVFMRPCGGVAKYSINFKGKKC